MHFGNEIDGAVFCGTLNVPYASPLLLPVLNMLCDRFGAHAQVDKVVSAFQKAQVLLTKDERAAVSWLSANAENWDNYEADDMCGFPFKLGGYRDLVALACEACESDWAQLIPEDLPLILYPGFKHEILNEKNNDVVYNDILAFFNNILDGSEVTA